MVIFISPPFGNYLDSNSLNKINIFSIRGSFTLLPRPGLITRILVSLRYDIVREGWINKIGLRNPGIDFAINKYRDDQSSIISVAITDHKEIPVLASKIPRDMNLEINVSCPNIDKKEDEMNLINQNISQFLNNERVWCILKLPPNIELRMVDYYYSQGFRQFHCSNTVPLNSISTGDLKDRGGLSGKCIMNYNRTLIPAIKKRYPDSIIIGGGGITSLEDIELYRKWGADHFSISSGLFNPLLIWNIRQFANLEDTLNLDSHLF
jgi:dihydroorotate dehydrogenase